MLLKIKKISTFHKCKHPSIGEVFSGCDNFSANFYSGINFVFGDVFSNGWACTYALSKGGFSGIVEGEVFIDDLPIDFKSLRQSVYYVAYNELTLLKKIKFKNILKFFEKWGDTKLNIYKQFELNKIDSEFGIMDRKFEQMSHWIYFCSCLVGILKGKRILCFPWINASEILIQSYRFNILSKYAQENDLIIIIPTPMFDNRAKKVIEYPYTFVVG